MGPSDPHPLWGLLPGSADSDSVVGAKLETERELHDLSHDAQPCQQSSMMGVGLWGCGELGCHSCRCLHTLQHPRV